LLWKDNVFKKLKKELIHAVMEVARVDREGMPGPHEACKAIAFSLGLTNFNIFEFLLFIHLLTHFHFTVTLQACVNRSLTLYLSEYESSFIAETKNYYAQESKKFARDLSISEFMSTVISFNVSTCFQ
jgi:cullin 1/cullin 2